jgi:hypothetical protein
MLKLNLKTESYWLDLPGKVKVKVKPITTALMSAAQSMAVDQYRKLVESGQVDAQNDSVRKGVGESLLIKALAQLAITEWEGVLAADSDAPAPVTEQNVSDLMDIWLIAQDFMKAYVTQFSLLETEGNVSAPAANGTSAAEAPTAASAA